MSQKIKQFTIHEDWTVVLLGFIIIGLSLFVFLPSVPVFKWNSGADLLNHVLNLSNLQVILWQFLYFISVGSLGALMTGKSVKNFLLGFPAVYILTVIALIIAGNSTIKGLN